jgi:hypothetical protein
MVDEGGGRCTRQRPGGGAAGVVKRLVPAGCTARFATIVLIFP